jgi:ABC-type phosphate transport system substrate-binding protein
MSVSLTAACTAIGALALSAGGAMTAQAAPTARADYQPGSNDVVGVGSDTLQYIVDFVANGDPSGDAGFNGSNPPFKIVSISATADQNARISYLNNSTSAAPKVQNPTVVLRQNTFPVQRPNGSGAGAKALVANTLITQPHIDFARMSSTPENDPNHYGATAVTNGWQGLQDFVLGQETLGLAVNSTTNSPAAGLSAKQLVAIYSCDASKLTPPGPANTPVIWSQVGGSSSDAVIPTLPQSGSGTAKTFLADLATANGGTAITLGSCVIQNTEENDPVAITSQATPADAIAPFSGSRMNLWLGKSGNTAFGTDPGAANAYFHDPTVAYPGSGSPLTPGVKLEPTTGNASDGNPAYADVRQLHIVYRWTDQTSTTHWQPGSALNWAQALFCNPGGGTTPYFQSAAGKLLIAEAGADPSVQSCLSAPFTN